MSEEDLKAELETVKAQLADVLGEGGSYRALQLKLDEAIQKHKDDAERHAKELSELRETLQKEKLEAMAAQGTSHAKEIADLKEKVLIPAQRDLHARQIADLKAKQEAELKSL